MHEQFKNRLDSVVYIKQCKRCGSRYSTLKKSDPICNKCSLIEVDQLNEKYDKWLPLLVVAAIAIFTAGFFK